MEPESTQEADQKRAYPLEDPQSTRGISVMLGTISLAFAVLGSIGAWWRFDGLVVPLRILATLGAFALIFGVAWIFFAVAWFHVWLFPLKNLPTPNGRPPSDAD